tara:strand:+ start:1511 stop:1834 length:324 start_codon:yes stop_codon:yes gene_type:complete
MQKNFITYSLIFFLIFSFFGFNFILSFIGNILILLLLIPLLLIGLTFLGLNFFRSKIKVCDNCGSTILGDNINCLYCGYELSQKIESNGISNDPSKETIEIEAEEIQ